MRFNWLMLIIFSFSTVSCEHDKENVIKSELVGKWLWMESSLYEDSVLISFDSPALSNTQIVLELKNSGKYYELHEIGGSWIVDRNGDWSVDTKANSFSLVYDLKENDIRQHEFQFIDGKLQTIQYYNPSGSFERSVWLELPN